MVGVGVELRVGVGDGVVDGGVVGVGVLVGGRPVLLTSTFQARSLTVVPFAPWFSTSTLCVALESLVVSSDAAHRPVAALKAIAVSAPPSTAYPTLCALAADACTAIVPLTVALLSGFTIVMVGGPVTVAVLVAVGVPLVLVGVGLVLLTSTFQARSLTVVPFAPW